MTLILFSLGAEERQDTLLESPSSGAIKIFNFKIQQMITDRKK